MPVLDPYHLTLLLIALISGVISPIVVQITKYYISLLRLPPKKDEVTKAIKYEDLIAHKLDKIKDTFHVDRVWLLEFHNGTHKFSGKSLQKFSVTYEVSNPGIAREGQTTQNIPTSLFSKFFKTLSEKDHFIVSDVEKVNVNNSSLQSFFESRGTKSFFAIGIRNIENFLIGVLCLETIAHKSDMSEAEISDLKKDANILSGYLEVS